MKKLIITFFILISTTLYASNKITEIAYKSINNNEIYILCIDGYKYVLVNERFASPTPSNIVQMFKKADGQSKTVPVECNE